MNQTAGRGIYFLKNYGVKYVLVSAIDSIAFRYFKNLGHIIMPVRAGIVKKYLKKTYQEVFDKYCRNQKMRGGGNSRRSSHLDMLVAGNRGYAAHCKSVYKVHRSS